MSLSGLIYSLSENIKTNIKDVFTSVRRSNKMGHKLVGGQILHLNAPEWRRPAGRRPPFSENRFLVSEKHVTLAICHDA